MPVIADILERHHLKDETFSIISDNCWGNNIYKTLKRPYNTPFIALFIHPKCYLQILSNLDFYLSQELYSAEKSKYSDVPSTYPVAKFIDDSHEAELHFLHYTTFAEANEKWTRRCERLKQEIAKGTKLLVKFGCDEQSSSCAYFEQFHALPFDFKLSISTQLFDHPKHIGAPNVYHRRRNEPYNGLALFRKRYQYFDFINWVKDQKIETTSRSRILSFAI